MNGHLMTTVVGSYPPKLDITDIYALMRGAKDPVRSAIEVAVNDQTKAGVQLISDGQVRADFVTLFAGNIPGFKVKGGRPNIVDYVTPPEKPVAVDDYIFAKSITKCEVKGIVTGPSTLAYASVVDEKAPYKSNDDPELIYDIAGAQAMEIMALIKAGAKVVQIDEPVFSVGMDLETAIPALNGVIKGVKVPVVHVCGDIRSIFKKLLELNVSVLDHEFTNTANLEVMEREIIEAHDVHIGYGCVDSNSMEVEPVEVIEKRILAAVEKLGAKNIWIDPDCGLRNLTRESAFAKLSNMVQAAKNMGASLNE
ncbi:MAG: methionine synthase [Methanosarcinales archaeon Met12]|nr:MAG: methionine synthase [Methanosarcinales archaeon Met12]